MPDFFVRIFYCFLFSFFLSTSLIYAQEVIVDTIKISTALPDVIIKALEQNKKLKELPAAVNYINKSVLEKFSSSSIVQAVNSFPGVRMEERSPGSYRFNIRGSSLRSPFGVRNVKVYYNDIPITDPGGTTYLNQLGYYNFNSIEILKGPASSLYGAGTGGVMLIESMNENEPQGISAEYTTGSYQLHNLHGAVVYGNKKSISRMSYQHQESDGYRDHSALRRDVVSWSGIFRLDEKKFLKASFLYGDLFYETPGALTKAEFELNPKASRPTGGGFPSAANAKASIRQRSFISGISYTQNFTTHWQNKTVLYGMFTELKNPAIRNYGKTSEPHVGGRTIFKYNQTIKKAILNIDVGAEWQQGFSTVNIYKNVGGNADSLRSVDEINNRQQFVFTQISLDVKSFSLIAGASWNLLKIKFQRFAPATSGKQTRRFDNQLSPRIAFMKKLVTQSANINVYTSVSKGFSPPTAAELLPTGSAINLLLNAEEGINYDLGFKVSVNGKLYMDVNAFIFYLQNTIVQRRDAGGGDFYLNAGKTKQHGVESYISYALSQKEVNKTLFWISHTWHNFHYKKFRQLTTDYSGKQLPSVSPHTICTGMDFQMNNGFFAGLNYYYAGKIPLNDANTEYANAYHLLGTKIGFQKLIKEKWSLKLNAGAENLLNEKYSLGNDINAFGGRYYNAAAGRNYFISVMLQLVNKTNKD